VSELAKISFEEYMTSTIEKMAKGDPYDRELWEERMKLYLNLVSGGMSPKAARAVMELYMK